MSHIATANQTSDEQQSWQRILLQLKKEFGAENYTNWLRHIQLVKVTKSEVTMSVPTRFIREWVNTHYKNTVLKLWKSEYNTLIHMDIIVRSAKPLPPADQEAERAHVVEAKHKNNENITVLHFQDENAPTNLSSPLDRRFTFENFVTGSANKLAHACAKSVANSAEVVPGNNPLYLYGGVGLGKTHLMHAIAHQIRKNQPGRHVVYLSAERFMYQFVKALREKNIMEFKDNFRSIDVLLLDDIQFICGKDSTQEEFFHTFNALFDDHKQLVISCDRSPSDLSDIDDRIRSRLGWGLVADIGTSSYDLRLGIVQSKVKQMKNVTVPTNVQTFLATKINSNIRELEGALNKVVAHSTLIDKPITLENTQHLLADLLRASEKIITIDEIQKKVAQHFSIKLSDMTSQRRLRSVARPRQIAMYLCKQLTTRSLSEIGRKFGGKDHTTVMHALKRIESLLLNDNDVKEDVDRITRILN